MSATVKHNYTTPKPNPLFLLIIVLLVGAHPNLGFYIYSLTLDSGPPQALSNWGGCLMPHLRPNLKNCELISIMLLFTTIYYSKKLLHRLNRSTILETKSLDFFSFTVIVFHILFSYICLIKFWNNSRNFLLVICINIIIWRFAFRKYGHICFKIWNKI